MADQIVITEKTSQAKDVRAAVGDRYRADPAGRGPPVRSASSPRRSCRPGRAGRRPAAAGRPLRHQAGHGRQQGRQAQSDPRGAAHREARLARHRLRPRGPADRPGDPGALRLPRHRSCGRCSPPRTRRRSATPSPRPSPTPSMPASTPPPSRGSRPTRSTTCR